MAGAVRTRIGGRRCRFAGLAVLLVAGVSLANIAASSYAFAAVGTEGAGAPARVQRGRVGARAKAAPSSSSSDEKVSIVKVTEENKATTAGVLGGVVGLALGGVWVGAALFAATSYLARRDDDVGAALKGVASGGLEVLNFGGYVNDKYSVSGKIGNAIDDALGEEGKKSVSGVVDSIKVPVGRRPGHCAMGLGITVRPPTEEIGFKESAHPAQILGHPAQMLDEPIAVPVALEATRASCVPSRDTLGNLLTSAGDLADQAVTKAVDLNKEYKVTDQLAEKIEEATKSSKSK